MAAIIIFSDTSYNLEGPTTGIWIGITEEITSLKKQSTLNV